ncbi:MAG: VCBS repeat-containing protein [Deltaproteobacteria bacterium]|nr:VCBS repeat-containing protein [Deltaproteobacteria bacterium]
MSVKHLIKSLPAFFIIAILLLLPSAGFAKQTSVAVLPWKVNSAEDISFIKAAMADMLASRIGAASSIGVVREEAVKAELAGYKGADITDTVAAEVGKKLNADYVLYGSLTVIGASVSLDAKLLNTKDGAITPFYGKGAGMDSVIPMVDKLSADVSPLISPLPVPAQTVTPEMKGVVIAPPSPKEAPKDDGFIVKPKADALPSAWKSAKFDGQFIAIESADLDKDGVKEFFLLKENSVTIARVSAGKLETIKEIRNDTGVQNVAVSIIDSDDDGSPEVYVSGVRFDAPYTSVIEFKDNAYKVTATGIKWLVRTIDAGGKKPVLIGQSFRKGDGIHGPVRELRKEGGAVVPKGVFEAALPARLDIYRFEVFPADTGAGTPHGDAGMTIAALDERDYLRLYKKDKGGKWEQTWKSAEFYGGSLNFIEATEERPGAPADVDPFIVEGRFHRADLKGDKRPELIIKRNIPGGLGRSAKGARSYTGGSVISLSWDGEGLVENWRTKIVAGYIADFFIDDLDVDGAKDIVMLIVVGTGGFFGGVKSYILSSRLSI